MYVALYRRSLAAKFNLEEEEKRHLLPGGQQEIFTNRLSVVPDSLPKGHNYRKHVVPDCAVIA